MRKTVTQNDVPADLMHRCTQCGARYIGAAGLLCDHCTIPPVPIPALLVAIAEWFQQYYRISICPDLPNQFLDASTGTNYFAKSDYPNKCILLHARKDGETRIWRLDEEWFANIRIPMEEVAYQKGEFVAV